MESMLMFVNHDDAQHEGQGTRPPPPAAAEPRSSPSPAPSSDAGDGHDCPSDDLSKKRASIITTTIEHTR